MLDNKGFDLWADGYDQSVCLSDEDDTYPFAGYRQILNEIYKRVLTGQGHTVLDIGFGTAALAARLYEHGLTIYGQDFSEKMIEMAKDKMPEAKLFQGDFSGGLVEELKQKQYDTIIATYSLHHLTDEQKINLIQNLLLLLNDGGCLYIGDVAFETRAELEFRRNQIGGEWDDDEIYFVVDEIRKEFPQMKYEQFSFCSGLLFLEV